MALRTAAGTKIYIGPVNTVADTANAYGLLSYTLIGQTEEITDIADKAEEVTFKGLGSRRTETLKGVFDAGTTSVTVGADQSDAGQDALVAAAASDDTYAFKVVYPDHLTSLTASPPGSGSITYFRALVMSAGRMIGTTSNVLKRKFELRINSKIVEVDAT